MKRKKKNKDLIQFNSKKESKLAKSKYDPKKNLCPSKKKTPKTKKHKNTISHCKMHVS